MGFNACRRLVFLDVITDRGRQLLTEQPARIDIALLQRFEQFRQFQSVPLRVKEAIPGSTNLAQSTTVTATPEEALDQAYHSIRAELASELLARLKIVSPAFFEDLVVELLLKMGYGRSRADAGQTIEGVGDERNRRHHQRRSSRVGHDLSSSQAVGGGSRALASSSAPVTPVPGREGHVGPPILGARDGEHRVLGQGRRWAAFGCLHHHFPRSRRSKRGWPRSGSNVGSILSQPGER